MFEEMHAYLNYVDVTRLPASDLIVWFYWFLLQRAMMLEPEILGQHQELPQ
jgi:hypothetical protein